MITFLDRYLAYQRITHRTGRTLQAQLLNGVSHGLMLMADYEAQRAEMQRQWAEERERIKARALEETMVGLPDAPIFG